MTPEVGMLLAIVAVAFLFRQAREIAVAGVACYGLSYALSTAYTLVPTGSKVLVWEGGMVAVLAMYVIFAEFVGTRARWLLAVPAVLLLQFAGIDRHILEAVVKATIALVILMAYFRISYNDVLGKMVCAILFIAEGWAVLEKMTCPYLPQLFEANSQCGRAFGPVEPFLATAVTTACLFWIGSIWSRTKTPRI